jgi:leucyl aminopeptidase
VSDKRKMNFLTKETANPSQEHVDCIIIPVYENGVFSAAAKQIDDTSSQELTNFLMVGDFTGKIATIEVLYNLSNITATRVMLVGCGKQDDFDIENFQRCMVAVGKALKETTITQVTSWLGEALDDQMSVVRETVLVLSSSAYLFEYYKSKKNNDETESNVSIEQVTIVTVANDAYLSQSVGIAEGVELARNLANHPANVCTPAYLVDVAEELSNNFDAVSLEVLEETEMEELGMGAFISVSKGSKLGGKLIVLQYNGADKETPAVALVGKGITFDTGGISLKPGANMDEMKFDMGGAASVLGTVQAVASMHLPINLVAVVAAAENMPSGHASKPGDIVTSMSGKTIEVLNTDAEGRLVLCDALTYVAKYNPAVVIDIATLTGACIVALGHHISGLVSNDDSLATDIMQAGEMCRDEAWRLPMNAKYTKQLKSEFADLGNIAAGGGGTITAGCFLAEFTKDYTWAHLDIAGTAWKGKAATGRPVPLLTQYLINYSC